MSWPSTHYHQNASMSLSASGGLVLTIDEDGRTQSLSCFLDADQLAALAFLALNVRRELQASQRLRELEG